MEKVIDAIFENGVFRPVNPVTGVPEQTPARITVTVAPQPHPFDGWVGGVSDEDAEQMRKAIEEEFEQIEPDDWK